MALAFFGAIIVYLKFEKNEDVVKWVFGAGIRYAYIRLKIFLAMSGVVFLLMIGR